jgi:hypothetical protein
LRSIGATPIAPILRTSPILRENRTGRGRLAWRRRRCVTAVTAVTAVLPGSGRCSARPGWSAAIGSGGSRAEPAPAPPGQGGRPTGPRRGFPHRGRLPRCGRGSCPRSCRCRCPAGPRGRRDGSGGSTGHRPHRLIVASMATGGQGCHVPALQRQGHTRLTLGTAVRGLWHTGPALLGRGHTRLTLGTAVRGLWHTGPALFGRRHTHPIWGARSPARRRQTRRKRTLTGNARGVARTTTAGRSTLITP